MDYITTHFRDDIEISFKEWDKLIDEDIVTENKNLGWDITGAVSSDLGNSRDIYINGHSYKRRTVTVYDSAKELLDELIWDGHYDIICDVLKELSEEEIFTIISKIKYVTINDDKLLLRDEKDW